MPSRQGSNISQVTLAETQTYLKRSESQFSYQKISQQQPSSRQNERDATYAQHVPETLSAEEIDPLIRKSSRELPGLSGQTNPQFQDARRRSSARIDQNSAEKREEPTTGDERKPSTNSGKQVLSDTRGGGSGSSRGLSGQNQQQSQPPVSNTAKSGSNHSVSLTRQRSSKRRKLKGISAKQNPAANTQPVRSATPGKELRSLRRRDAPAASVRTIARSLGVELGSLIDSCDIFDVRDVFIKANSDDVGSGSRLVWKIYFKDKLSDMKYHEIIHFYRERVSNLRAAK
ncbi:uncharacterized protein LOC142338091 [Convolutriloba macropyga]|uniref:uncharacterized protein LOC142338091 n=1 Tax=Convolutriloba macropyga TaxID=536237 RepID=UPI003F51C238